MQYDLIQIQTKTNSLIDEASRLSHEKEELLKRISEIDIRLHQIVGAISVLDEITRESLPSEE